MIFEFILYFYKNEMVTSNNNFSRFCYLCLSLLEINKHYIYVQDTHMRRITHF